MYVRLSSGCGSLLAGNSRWVYAIEWSGQKSFGTSPTVKFVVDGAEAGSLNSYGPLSFLKVCGQGCIFDCDSVALLIYHLVTFFYVILYNRYMRLDTLSLWINQKLHFRC